MICVEIQIKVSAAAEVVSEIECSRNEGEDEKKPDIVNGKRIYPWMYKSMMRNIKKKSSRRLDASVLKHFFQYTFPQEKHET